MASDKTHENADTIATRLETGVPHTTDQLADAIGGTASDVYQAKALIADDGMIPNRSVVWADGSLEAVSTLLRDGQIKHCLHLYKRAKARRTSVLRDLNLNHYPAQRMTPHDPVTTMAVVKAESDLLGLDAEIQQYHWRLSNLGVTV
jgi:hypothetical protein